MRGGQAAADRSGRRGSTSRWQQLPLLRHKTANTQAAVDAAADSSKRAAADAARKAGGLCGGGVGSVSGVSDGRGCGQCR